MPTGSPFLATRFILHHDSRSGSPPCADRPNFVFIALDDLVRLTREHLEEPRALLNVLIPNSILTRCRTERGREAFGKACGAKFHENILIYD